MVLHHIFWQSVWLVQVFVESLLCSSRVENIRLAGQLMHCSKVQHGGGGLLLAASRTSFSALNAFLLNCWNACRSAKTSPSVCPSGAKVTPSRSPTTVAWTWCSRRPASTSTRRPLSRIHAWIWPGQPLGGTTSLPKPSVCVPFLFWLNSPLISVRCRF